MSVLHIPRYAPRQLVRVALLYVYPDGPVSQTLARVESVQPDPRDVQAPTYAIKLVAGPHAGETHEVPEIALSSLGGDAAT